MTVMMYVKFAGNAMHRVNDTLLYMIHFKPSSDAE